MSEELTPTQRRQLEQAFTTIPKVGPKATDVIAITFVDDGLVAYGKTWYRGEELQVDRDSMAYKASCDVEGVSWLTLTEDEQIVKYGRRMFRPGQWVGEAFDLNAVAPDGTGYTEAEKATLAELNKTKVAPAAKRGTTK